MSTAEGHASREAIEGAIIDELVSSGLLTQEKLVEHEIMQEGEDVETLIDVGVISLQNLAGMGFKIDAAEAAVLTAAAQEMLVAARIIPDSGNLLLDFDESRIPLEFERSLIAMAAIHAHQEEEAAGKKEDLKRVDKVLVKLLFEDGLLSKEWLVSSGIVQQRETRTVEELIESGEISLNVLRQHSFTITEAKLFNLQIGLIGDKLFRMMGLVDNGPGTQNI